MVVAKIKRVLRQITIKDVIMMALIIATIYQLYTL